MKLSAIVLSMLAVLTLSVTNLKAETGSIEYDEFRGTGQQATAWQVYDDFSASTIDLTRWTIGPPETGANQQDPSIIAGKMTFDMSNSGAGLWNFGAGLTPKSVAGVKGVQFDASFDAYSGFTGGEIGASLYAGSSEIWLEVGKLDGNPVILFYVNGQERSYPYTYGTTRNVGVYIEDNKVKFLLDNTVVWEVAESNAVTGLKLAGFSPDPTYGSVIGTMDNVKFLYDKGEIDSTKWTITGVPFNLVTDPTDPTDKVARLSGADIAGSFLSVNRSLSKVKGVQIKARANCATYYTNEEGVIGIGLDDGNWSFWMQINGESIGGVDGPTIEMVWENTSTGATDFRRFRVSWDTWYELRIYVDSTTNTVNFYYITPDQSFTTPNFSYNYGGTLPSGPSAVEIYASVNNGDYVELDEARLLVDKQDITLSSSSVTVPEGSSNTVTVTFPANHPCDMPVVVTPGAGDTDLTISPTSFTLTPTSPTQVLTITAAEDADGANGSRTFELNPDGTITNPVITATESDNELPQIIITPDTLTVPENGTNTAIVTLTTYDVDVPITISAAGTDSDLTISPTSFTLTSSNPSQLVTVTAVDDADKDAGIETFTASSAGLDDATLVATEYDDDVIRVIATPGATAEGITNTQGVLVQLSKDPGTDVVLTINRTSGDTDLTCTASITLNSGSWNTTNASNYLAIAAAEDNSDTENDTAVFTITGADEAATFTATSIDDDILLTINKTGLGSVTGTGYYDLNDDAPTIPVTAIPQLGQSFISWAGPDAGKVNDTSAEITYVTTVTDATITAQFTAPKDDDDEWYEGGGCSLNGVANLSSILPIIMALLGLVAARFYKR